MSIEKHLTIEAIADSLYTVVEQLAVAHDKAVDKAYRYSATETYQKGGSKTDERMRMLDKKADNLFKAKELAKQALDALTA